MRSHLLGDVVAATGARKAPCKLCVTPAHRQLFDRLAEATDLGHAELHEMMRKSRDADHFRRRVDNLARVRGVILNWDEERPAHQATDAPKEPT